MHLPKGATVTIIDGVKFNFFQNTGDEAKLTPAALPHAPTDADYGGATLPRDPTGHALNDVEKAILAA